MIGYHANEYRMDLWISHLHGTWIQDLFELEFTQTQTHQSRTHHEPSNVQDFWYSFCCVFQLCHRLWSCPWNRHCKLAVKFVIWWWFDLRYIWLSALMSLFVCLFVCFTSIFQVEKWYLGYPPGAQYRSAATLIVDGLHPVVRVGCLMIDYLLVFKCAML